MIAADEFIDRIKKYKSQKNTNQNSINPTSNADEPPLRVFLGLSNYPDGSNLTSTVNLYSNLTNVAFFSKYEKPDLFFVLAILFGSRKEALNLFEIIFNKNKISSVSWDDVVEYLAVVENIYFANLQDMNFANFNKAIQPKTADYLLLSSDNKNIKEVSNCSSCRAVASIMHPSSRNLNENTKFWVNEYIINDFSGQIGKGKKKGALTYAYFQLK